MLMIRVDGERCHFTCCSKKCVEFILNDPKAGAAALKETHKKFGKSHFESASELFKQNLSVYKK